MNSQEKAACFVLMKATLVTVIGNLKWLSCLKQVRVHSARKLLCGAVRPEEMEEIYRWLYDNIELFGDDAQQDKAIMIIKQGLVDHTMLQILKLI